MGIMVNNGIFLIMGTAGFMSSTVCPHAKVQTVPVLAFIASDGVALSRS